MQYQQSHLLRLSQSAKKLIADGAWHPFAHDEKQFYRIRKNVLQRITITGAEERALFSLFDRVDPLPSQLFREGFRQEICIRQRDDHFVLDECYLTLYSHWQESMQFLREKNIELSRLNPTTLLCVVRIEAVTTESFFAALLAQNTLALTISAVRTQTSSDSFSLDEFQKIFHAAGETLLHALQKQKPLFTITKSQFETE